MMWVFFAVYLLLVIVAHELGHVLYFRWKLGRRVRLRFEKLIFKVGTPQDYERLSLEQKRGVWSAGVFAGGLVALLAPLPHVWKVSLWALYLVGCWKDLNNIALATKKLKKPYEG